MNGWRSPEGRPASSAAIFRVLVVEEDEVFNDILLWYLVDCGCEVATARTGIEALAYLRQTSFDVVLTDVVMPGMGGLHLLEEIRGAGSGLPVVVISGHADALTGEQQTELGVSRFLTKPCSLEEVMAAVREAAALPAREVLPGTDRSQLSVGGDAQKR
jgi:CheY-like chemotaxis protein